MKTMSKKFVSITILFVIAFSAIFYGFICL